MLNYYGHNFPYSTSGLFISTDGLSVSFIISSILIINKVFGGLLMLNRVIKISCEYRLWKQAYGDKQVIFS